MQPVEDLWTCNRCGWTYPNHHPSAKHRRNHKKVCGKVPGHIIEQHHDHAGGGSSDDVSSGDEHSGHHRHHEVKVAPVAEVASSAPAPAPAPVVESQPRSFDLSAALQKPSEAATPADAPAAVEEPKAPVQEAPKVEEPKPEVTPKPVLGSAVPHPEDDLWICRECGWTYPNAHPSAKHRRNHKKHCPGKAGAKVHAPGGSSDEDSDGEHSQAPKAVETTEKVNVAAPAAPVVEPEAEKEKAVPEPEPTPIVSATREFSLGSVAPKEEAAAAEAAPEKVKEVATPVAAPTAPDTPPAPVAAPKGSAVPHPDDDIWICKECGWTYPNHHPSAKHRRNHKKVCPGKKAAPVHVPGGSSDEDSGDEHHPHPVQATKPEVTTVPSEAPPSASREFNLESLEAEVKNEQAPAEKAPVKETEKEIPAETPAAPAPAPPAVVGEPLKAETPAAVSPAVDSKETKKDESSVTPSPAAPKVGSAVPHPEEDIWICRECGWTYPNHHPSAKHRRNHKKNCPGKVAAAAPAPGGSSDEDSGDERHRHQTPLQHAPKPELVNATSEAPPSGNVSREFSSDSLTKPEAKAEQTENGNVEVAKSVPNGAPVQEEAPATPAVVPKEVAKEEIPAQAPPPVESKEVSKESVTAPEPTKDKPMLGTAAPKVGSAVPHPGDDIWICKECGWTYPNHHPSAKHRRNHKKVCKGKVAAAATVPGGSSDEDSGDEHHHASALHATKPDVANGTHEVSPIASVSREFKVELAPAEAKVEVPESIAAPTQLLETPKAQAPVVQNETSPAVVLKEAPKEDIPAVVSNGTTKDEKAAETPAPVVAKAETSPISKETPKEETPGVESKVNKEEAKVAKPAASGSAVPHDDGDIWKCRECDWTYPNAHPSAKHRRNHKKHCPGKPVADAAAPAQGGSSDDDSDHDTHPSPPAAEATPVVASVPTEPVASVSRDFQLPTEEVKEEAAAPSTPKVEEPKVEEPANSPAQPDEVKAPAAVESSPPAAPAPALKVSSAAPHPEDPNDIWICKDCNWTYPNAHPSAKHRRNHKKQCPGKAAAVTPAPGGSSDEDSDHEHSSTGGKTAAPGSETAPTEVPVEIKERGMLNLGAQSPDKVVEADQSQKVNPVETISSTSVDQSRELEAKLKEELKKTVPAAATKAPHDPNDIWVCQQCGWTYPNAHPSAKHRRNHKKVCKKVPIAGTAAGGGSSSDASSDDDVGHFGKKKCFPCLS